MDKITKSELTSMISETLDGDVPKTTIDKVVAAMTQSVSQVIKDGNSITLPGFGTFKPRVREAREGRNPQTGATMQFPRSTTVSFSISSSLKKELN